MPGQFLPAFLQVTAGAWDGSTPSHVARAAVLDSLRFPPRRAEPAPHIGCSSLLLLHSANSDTRGGSSPIDYSASPSATHEARSSWEAGRCRSIWVDWFDPFFSARQVATGPLAPPREVFLLSLSSFPPSLSPLSSSQADQARLALASLMLSAFPPFLLPATPRCSRALSAR
jgi:hypothetical protein